MEGPASSTGKTIGYAVLGVLLGFVFLALSFLMFGAGHGWMSSGYSANSILVIPFLGAAVANRGRARGLVYGAVALAGMLVLDYWIVHETNKEGWHYFDSAMPISGLWLILWIAWQIAVLWTMRSAFRATRRQRS